MATWVNVHGFCFPSRIPVVKDLSWGTMDADAEKFAHFVTIPKTGTLSKYHFRTRVVTTGNSMRISFQDIDPATGFPDGNADEFRVFAMADGDDNVWKDAGIISSDGTDGGTKRSVTQGDRIAVVFDWDTWVAGNLQLMIMGSIPPNHQGFNNVASFLSAAWSGTEKHPIGALEYSDGSFAYSPTVFPGVDGSLIFNNTDSPDEVASKITIPCGMKVHGIWVRADLDAVCDLVLYDTDGSSVLASVSFDPDWRTIRTTEDHYLLEFADVTLVKDSTYFVALKPTSASDVRSLRLVMPDANYRTQLDGDTHITYVTRTDAGSWSGGDGTIRMSMGLMVSQIDIGAGGGGGGNANLLHGKLG